ncbi:MAG: DUF503 domain-containing protein [Firmicutes bacterium]|nr:DUF503 domain-containing protein [Bacillota bacterium]
MIIGAVTITIYAPWVHSLKEKRMIVKSICAKVSNRFNVSIAEINNHEFHQSIVLGIACVAGETGHADSIIDNVLNYIEGQTEGEVIRIERELR